MKNNLIKEEISRIREIMGFSLLVESKLPSSIWDELVRAFSKTDANDLELSLKNMDSSVDSLTRAILDTESKLGAKTDDIIAGLRAGTLTDDIAENLFANVLKQSDSTLKQTFLKNIDSNISDIFKTASDPNKKIKTSGGEKTLQDLADLNQLDSWVNSQKSFVDSSDFDSELKAAIKKQIDLDAAKIRAGKSITVDSPKTLDELHSVLSSRAIAEGFDVPTVSQLKVWQNTLQKKYSTPEDAWNDIKKMLKESKTLREQVKIVGDTVNVTTAEGKNLLNMFIPKSFRGWLTLAGVLGAISILQSLNLGEDEADEYIKKFIENCKKLQGSIRKRKDIGATLFQEFGGFVDNYYIEVIYNMTATPVTIKGNEGYIDINGTLTKLSELCDDNKLADGEFDNTPSEENNSSGISDATEKEFKTWWDSKGYADYTKIEIDGVNVSVNDGEYNYKKIADGKFE